MSIDVPQARSRTLSGVPKLHRTERATHATGPADHIVSAAKDLLWRQAVHLKRLIFGKPKLPDWMQAKLEEEAYRISDYDHAPRDVAQRPHAVPKPLSRIAEPPKPYLNIHQRLYSLDMSLYDAVSSTMKMWVRRNPVDRALLAMRLLKANDVKGQQGQLRLLAKMGSAAKAAIPELLRLLQASGNPEVCLAVVDTLFALDPRASQGEKMLAVLFAKPKVYLSRQQSSGSQGYELTESVVAPAVLNHLREAGVPVSGVLAEIILKDGDAITRKQALFFLENWLEKTTRQAAQDFWDGIDRDKIISALHKRLAADEALFVEKPNGDFEKHYRIDELNGAYDHNGPYDLYQEARLIRRLLEKWEIRVDRSLYERSGDDAAVAAK